MQHISKPKYGIIQQGLFSMRIVCGIVTGVRYTEDKPVYELSFGKDKYETAVIAETAEELFAALNIPTLQRINETHGLKIKFKHLEK